MANPSDPHAMTPEACICDDDEIRLHMPDPRCEAGSACKAAERKTLSGEVWVWTRYSYLTRLEALASAQPAPYTTYPCHCGIGEADLLDWVDSGLTMTCRKCGTKTVVSLSTDQPAPAPQETAAEDAEDLADALAMEARYRARGVEGLRAYSLPTTTETLSDQGGYVAAPAPVTTPHEET